MTEDKSQALILQDRALGDSTVRSIPDALRKMQDAGTLQAGNTKAVFDLAYGQASTAEERAAITAELQSDAELARQYGQECAAGVSARWATWAAGSYLMAAIFRSPSLGQSSPTAISSWSEPTTQPLPISTPTRSTPAH